MKYTTGTNVSLKASLGSPMNFSGNIALVGTISTGYHGANKIMTWYQSKTFRRLELTNSYTEVDPTTGRPTLSITSPYSDTGSDFNESTLTTKAISHNNYIITIQWNNNAAYGETWTFYGWWDSIGGTGTFLTSSNPYTVPSTLDDYQFCSYAEGTLPATCPVEGTMILMADDTLKPIEEIQPGDIVKSIAIAGMPDSSELSSLIEMYEWSDATLQLSPSVSTVIQNEVSQISKVININNGQFITSRTHTHIVKKEVLGGAIEWTCRPAFNLKVGDVLLGNGGTEIEITSIEENTGQFNVYALNVEEEDTYIANGIITHNAK